MPCAFRSLFLVNISANAAQEGSKARRDELLKWQAAAQLKWEDAKIFEVDAPAEGERGPQCYAARAIVAVILLECAEFGHFHKSQLAPACRLCSTCNQL